MPLGIPVSFLLNNVELVAFRALFFVCLVGFCCMFYYFHWTSPCISFLSNSSILFNMPVLVLYGYVNVLYYYIDVCLWKRKKEKIGEEGRKREKETLRWQCAVVHIGLVCVCMRKVKVGRHVVSFSHKVTYSNELHVLSGSHTPNVSINWIVWIRNVNNCMYEVWSMKELNVGSFQWFILLCSLFYSNVCQFKVSPFKSVFWHWAFNKRYASKLSVLKWCTYNAFSVVLFISSLYQLSCYVVFFLLIFMRCGTTSSHSYA